MAGRGTVSEALREAAAQLQQAGVASPLVDARLLMAHVLDAEPTQLFLLGDDPAPSEVWPLVRRRAAREPLQHITGRAWFYGLPMLAEPGAFIPRPETELLVDWAVRTIRETGARRVLDLCTGPGTIALAVSSQFPDAQLSITAVDIDATALDFAGRNHAYLQDQGLVPGGVRFVQADLSDPGSIEVLGFSEDYDVVLCNPPYVPEEPGAYEDSVEPEVLADPHHAVFSGADGMELMPHIVAAARAAVKPGGVVAIEHDDSTGPATLALLEDGFEDREQHYDLTERPRFVSARKI
ncbi:MULTISPECIES: peptide chain release factor N(5)-glutamine methyltransferase [Corynebacterium]|uniref:peptide chain release factor N(5)-glutamine methyltransferase n=1 Tax=Corynebacterium TaxID=1716 RepID=UPI001CE495EB|nr:MULTISPECIES: peptide chain release factor N(5)-glutamine methyltransferase [Corynebacterium]